jgi:thiamine-phosphate pyrophosphorylase
VFATGTKGAKTRCELETLSIWQETMETPCVAIGGVAVDNVREVARAGADFAAVCAGVWSYGEGPAAAVAALNREIAAGVAERG